MSPRDVQRARIALLIASGHLGKGRRAVSAEQAHDRGAAALLIGDTYRAIECARASVAASVGVRHPAHKAIASL